MTRLHMRIPAAHGQQMAFLRNNAIAEERSMISIIYRVQDFYEQLSHTTTYNPPQHINTPQPWSITITSTQRSKAAAL
jgi:hypothetical protein